MWEAAAAMAADLAARTCGKRERRPSGRPSLLSSSPLPQSGLALAVPVGSVARSEAGVDSRHEVAEEGRQREHVRAFVKSRHRHELPRLRLHLLIDVYTLGDVDLLIATLAEVVQRRVAATPPVVA